MIIPQLYIRENNIFKTITTTSTTSQLIFIKIRLLTHTASYVCCLFEVQHSYMLTTSSFNRTILPLRMYFVGHFPY